MNIDLIITLVGLIMMAITGQRLCRLEDDNTSSLVLYWVGLIMALVGIGMGLLHH